MSKQDQVLIIEPQHELKFVGECEIVLNLWGKMVQFLS